MSKINWITAEDKAKQEQEYMQRQEEADYLKKALPIVLRLVRDWVQVDSFTDEELNSIINLYPTWSPSRTYDRDEIIQYKNQLYKVLQTHTSQSDWLPNEVPALYLPIAPPTIEDGTEIVPDWVQPTGAHDAYNIGDRVLFEDKIYESLIDGNSWSPREYSQGWQLIK